MCTNRETGKHSNIADKDESVQKGCDIKEALNDIYNDEVTNN